MNRQPTTERQRLDHWLWAARFFKTRSLAREAVAGGKVHLDGQRAKPGHGIRPDVLLRVRRGEEEIEVQVLALAGRRGPASEAQALYRETEASVATREKQAELRTMAALGTPQSEGRPDKYQRRQRARQDFP